MATSRRLTFCVLLIILYVCCATNLQPEQHKEEQQTEVSTRIHVIFDEGQVLSRPVKTFGRDRVKRGAANCPVLETQGGRGFERIIDGDSYDTKLNFFIQPQPGFNRLVFRAKLNNKLTPGSWKYSRESLVVSSSQIKKNETHPTWIPVEIKYFKNEVTFGPDRHALRVKVGGNVDKKLITRWWRTHSYEGFTVDAEGPLKFFMKCNSLDAVAEPVVDGQGMGVTVLVACVLTACFLMVVCVVAVYLLIAGRTNPPLDTQGNEPPVPKSLTQGRHVSQYGSSDHIYDTIDESSLAKYRKNLESGSFAVKWAQRGKDHSGGLAKGYYENTKTGLDLTVRDPRLSPEIPRGDAGRTKAASLLEEKESMRERFGLDSPLESHYVEMHGIVSRTSSLNK